MKMTATEIFFARTFATKIFGHIDGRNFHDSRNATRTQKKQMEDNIRGKLGEMAVANYIGLMGIPSLMDFEIYDSKGKGDDFDVIANGKAIDVKVSKPNSRCLMVERKKWESWHSRKHFPDYLSMVSVTGDNMKYEVNYMFGITWEKFKDKSKLYERGDDIPNTRYPLEADNYIVTVDDCENNVEMARFIKNKK